MVKMKLKVCKQERILLLYFELLNTFTSPGLEEGSFLGSFSEQTNDRHDL